MKELEQAGLAGAYMVILAAARNRLHLETLHGQLAPNRRLLMKDYILLREHWKWLWQGQRASGGELPSESFRDVIANTAGPTANLGLYYARRLDNGRPSIDTHSHDHAPREIVVSGIKPPRGLAVNICGIRFRVNCTFFGYELMVELSVATDELTEEATYHILNCDRLMKLGWNVGRRAHWIGGHEVNFILVFEDMNELKTRATMKVPCERMLQATSEFAHVLSDLISRELAFRVDICRLMPVGEDAPWEAVRFTDRSGFTWVECYD